MPTNQFQDVLKLVAPHLPGAGYAVTLRSLGERPEVLFVGGALQSLTGLDSFSLEQSPELWERCVHPEDADALARALESLTGGAGGSVEYRIVAENGDVRWLREDLAVLPGVPVRAFGVVHDVTSDREEISRLEERLWRAQLMESLGALMGGVANDFSDLLNTILATAPLVAEEQGLSGVSRANLRIVEGAAARGSALVNQILEFSTRQRERVGAANVSTMARGLAPILARVLGQKIGLSVRSEEDLWLAECDPVQVEQVIFNLVLNAKDAMPRGGSITIGSLNAEVYAPMTVEGGVLPAGRYVHLMVADGGSGITREDRERLFDRHYTTKQGRGAGFGLWTVRRIVESCGGGLVVESHESEGSTFHVYFPCKEASVVPLPDVATVEANEPRSGLRILLVDDYDLVGGVLERSLVRDGHSVVVAKSLGEWIPTLEGPSPAFNLLIVDIGRLEEGGRGEALTERLVSFPVIFTSRLGARALDRHEGLRQRGIFLPKPVEPVVLRETIARATEVSSGDAHREASGTCQRQWDTLRD